MTNKRQKVSGPDVLRLSAAEVAIVDEATRTFTLSWASDDVAVPRYGWDGDWLEVLGLDPGECDLSRLNSGNAPFLWGHDTYSRESNIGVVEKAWIVNGRGLAQVRLSMRDDVASIWQDVKDKILTNVSTRYAILERTLMVESMDGPSEYRVTSWLPSEISIVSIPADDTVGIGRSAEVDTRQFTLTDIPSNEAKTMAEQETKPAAPAIEQRQAAPVVAPSTEDMTRAASEASVNAVRAERARVSDISDLARKHDLVTEGDAAIRAGDTVEAFRVKALEALAERSKLAPNHPAMRPGKDELDKQREAAEGWLFHRGNEKIDGKIVDVNGNPFRGMKLLDMARASCERAGINPRGMAPVELVRQAISHSTSDFPILLQNVMHKTLLNAYQAVPDVWRSFCAVGTLSDFRPHYRYRMGSFGNLSTVLENGEFTQGTIADAERESITGATKGKLLNISRQMIINDDLGGFLSLSRAMGRGAARTVEVDVFALLASNPATGDTGLLFNATAQTTAGGHANLNTGGAAPSVTGFDAVRQAMAAQLDVGGNDYTSVRPYTWLGPLATGGAARVVNDALYNPDDSNKYAKPNISKGLFTQIVDTPRLTGNIWYAFADPSVEPVIEVGFLDGQQSPYLEMDLGFEIDGVTWKVRLDYGVAAVGYRGAYKVTY